MSLLAVWSWTPGTVEGQRNGCEGTPAIATWATWGVTVEWDGPEIGPVGSRGQPRLCVLSVSGEDARLAVLVGITSPEQFREAKQDAAVALVARGLSPCQVGRWGYQGVGGLPLRLNDSRDSTVECQPGVRLVDEAAGALVDEVYAALETAVQVTDAQLGWRPSRRFTVFLGTSPASLAEAARPMLGRANNVAAERNSRVTEQGRPSFFNDPLGGGVLQIQLSDRQRENVEFMRDFVIHEYTHFAQGTIVNGDPSALIPKWFMEGQANYQAKRNAQRPGGGVIAAREDVIAGRAPRLTEIAAWPDWDRRESAGVGDLYNRGTAAVSLLVERYGADALTSILRESAAGSLEQFQQRLSALTELSPDELDASIDQWLTDIPFLKSGAEGVARVEALRLAEQRVEMKVTFTGQVPCGPRPGAWVLLNALQDPDGSIQTINVQSYGTVSLRGVVSDLGVTGVLGVKRTEGEPCETVPIEIVPM